MKSGRPKAGKSRKSVMTRLQEEFSARCRVIAQDWGVPVGDVAEHFAKKGGINREYRRALNRLAEQGSPVG